MNHDATATSVITLIRATRPPFLTVSAVGCLIGFALSWQQNGSINLWACVLAIVIAVAAQAAANVINDYFDALSGTDANNVDRISPFTGGSRMVQDHLLTESQVIRLGIAILIFAMIAGAMLLQYLQAWNLIWIGLAGLALAWAYSASPLQLMGRGIWGEIAIVAAWALIVIGSALLEQHRVSLSAVLCGVAYGLLVANILYANQIPDIRADRGAAKLTLAVITPTPALWVWYAIFALGGHALVVIAVNAGLIKPMALLSVLALPFSIGATRSIKRTPLTREPMQSAIHKTILGAHAFGILLAAGIVLG